MDAQVGARLFGSLAEGDGDHRLGRLLFDRITDDTIEWAAGQLDSLRTWAHELRWNSPRDPIAGFKMGRFDGLPRDHDAYSTAQYLAQFAARGCEFVLILRDEDGVVERAASIKAGVESFIEKYGADLRVVVGCPSLELESWILSGFSPRNDREEERLKQIVAELGFDPTSHPERLTDKKDHERRSPKRVVALLCENDVRSDECLLLSPLSLLRERGNSNGLSSFLSEAATTAKHIFGT